MKVHYSTLYIFYDVAKIKEFPFELRYVKMYGIMNNKTPTKDKALHRFHSTPETHTRFRVGVKSNNEATIEFRKLL
jgi:hypothetical protein